MSSLPRIGSLGAPPPLPVRLRTGPVGDEPGLATPGDRLTLGGPGPGPGGDPAAPSTGDPPAGTAGTRPASKETPSARASTAGVSPPAPSTWVATQNGVAVHATGWGALVLDDSSACGALTKSPDADPDQRTSESFTKPVRNAVVIGGGPGGLATAIELAERGIQVTVSEIRSSDYQRPHHLNARMSTLASFEDYGVFQEVQAASGLPEDLVPDLEQRGADGKAVLESESIAQVRISDVERALYRRASELGVTYIPHHRVVLGEPDENGMYSARLEKVQIVDGAVQGLGEFRSLGTPDLVIVADGAGSPTRAALGIDFLEESAPRVYLGGLVNRALDSSEHGYAKMVNFDNGELRHLMATGHRRYPQTWVSVEADGTAKEMTPEERTRHLASRASLVMHQQIKPEDISWGAGQITVVQNRRAATTVAGNNVVLIGDASRTGSVWQSGGLNLALTADVSDVVQLVDEINRQGASRQEALQSYNQRAQTSTTAWHQAGRKELQGEFPDSDIPLICAVPDDHPVANLRNAAAS